MLQNWLNESALAWQETELPKGTVICPYGKVERNIYYVKSGLVKAVYETEEDEFTIRFGYKGSIITSLVSYMNNEPSNIKLEVVRKVSLLQTTKKNFESFINFSSEIQQEYINLLHGLAADFMERELDLLHSSPLDRIERLRKRSPQVFQEVPNKYIASYLRMSPETFSRLLNQE